MVRDLFSILLIFGSAAFLPACPSVVLDPCLEPHPEPEFSCDSSISPGAGAGAGENVYDVGPGQMAVGEEACGNLVDDDGDGLVDEGCDCSGESRECVGRSNGECGVGTQFCDDGRWSAECMELQAPYRSERMAAVEVVLSHEQWSAGQSEVVTAAVTVTASCEGISIPSVMVRFETQSPQMWTEVKGLDDGGDPDVTAGDGVFTAALPEIFGPGVASQTIHVRAETGLDGERVGAGTTLEWLEGGSP